MGTAPEAGPKVQTSHGSPPGKSPGASTDLSVDAPAGESQEDAESEAGCSQSASTSGAASQPGSPRDELVEPSQHEPQCPSEDASVDSNIPSPPKSEAASLCASQQAASSHEAQVASPMGSEDNFSPAESEGLDSQDAESHDSSGNEEAVQPCDLHKPQAILSEVADPSSGSSVNGPPMGELVGEAAAKSGGSTASFQSDDDTSSDE